MPWVRLLILSCLILPLGSCASSAVVAAAGVTAGFGLAQGQAEGFINGELKAARLVTLEHGIDAVLATLNELHLDLRSNRRGRYDAYFRGVADGGPEFKISVKYKSPVVTKFEIRIGIMGDQAVSRLVLARLDAHLGIEHMPWVPPDQSPIVKPNGPSDEDHPSLPLGW